jgi:septum formation protein
MLHLASKSPRRRELLRMLGLDFGILDLDIPEIPDPAEPAEDYVRRVAREKAGAGLLRVIGQADAVVLGADTEVVLDGRIYGKPADAADAAEMLRSLSGRTHVVISAVSVVSAGREAHAVSISDVEFAPIAEDEIAAYLATGEWDGKAGAYAIQGMAQAFVRRLSGSQSGVMGLPLHETAGLLRGFGLFPPVPPQAHRPAQAAQAAVAAAEATR